MEFKVKLDRNYGSHRKKKVSCPNCGRKKVFVRYFDFEKLEYLPERFGRCDREDSCGYHEIPPYNSESGKRKRIPVDLQIRSMEGVEESELFVWLSSIFPSDKVRKVFEMYGVGIARKWHNGTIFWQIDKYGKVRSGKIVRYGSDGKRWKGGMSWVHSEMGWGEEFELEQCLFGENLLKVKNEKVVNVYESEKTALIAELSAPGMGIHMACGSMSGIGGKSVNWGRIRSIRVKKIVLYPDSSKEGKCFRAWKNLANQMNDDGMDVSVVDVDGMFVMKDREKGLDVGDLLIWEKANPYRFREGEWQEEDPGKAFYLPF